ncbi:extradiol ring-cleavage dioxygenase [Beijerinckia sp. L45]|uniref:DODA-type extradiol aromatic ring-opening family dioxygenase n=1 Tax=Beijerinckia sp. L45 TaxID=1641855 RepID=UPI00131E1E77|nr:extradiol ring-cleavage dioxygenase [Beijerinckia sp. L45]
MSKIVATYVIPHTPSFVSDVLATGDASDTFRFFAEMRRHLERSRPDLIVSISNDHFNTFFLDNWPTFAIGLAERTGGPSDRTPGMPRYEIKVARDLAAHLLGAVVENGFDFAQSQEFDLDHGTLVPLHFMTPDMKIPIVPIFINCIVRPLPAASRCHRLGAVLREALGRWEPAKRIAVVASGSLSLEIGGPRAFLNKTFGVPDPQWASWVLDRVRTRQHAELIQAATETRMFEAGNVAGELLTWITALGIVGETAPDLLFEQPALGNAFAAWGAEGGA